MKMRKFEDIRGNIFIINCMQGMPFIVTGR